MSIGGERDCGEEFLWADLVCAYLATTYRAWVDGQQIDIRIGEKTPDLDLLFPGKCWAFISASNPGSVLASDNPSRTQLLRRVLEESGRLFFRGLGIPDQPGWEAEESFLVVGMEMEEAVEIGRNFGQNAIVAACAGCRATLLCCTRN